MVYQKEKKSERLHFVRSPVKVADGDADDVADDVAHMAKEAHAAHGVKKKRSLG